ncbi:nucleotidyltransferase domain-containing protein [Martelella mangrovi]|uniref:Nucleotidyltransferase n=1 Tax=Martelella mangrovi TaxID=1397477 RepID=A0ABV2I9I7_9HYPH
MGSEDAIPTITGTIERSPEIDALYLSGSFAVGLEDEYSDIDFVLVAGEGASDAVAALWRKAVEAVGEPVLWRDRVTFPSLINAVTEDWLRIDVIILKPEQLKTRYRNELRVLFDRAGLRDTLADRPEQPQPDPKRLKYQFEEFIRILGLLDVAAGRGEYINGVTGIFHLRNLLVDLLIQETAAPHRGGALHLNRLITEEQKALMRSLPSPAATREAMIDVHLAYARAYLPRARRLATRRGVEWPERFEAATWKHLHDRLRIERPYDPA